MRDLNYDKYFVEGQQIAPTLDTYHSHNTTRLVPEVVAHFALASVPDLREVLHLPRIGLLHVGRVEYYERVAVYLRRCRW